MESAAQRGVPLTVLDVDKDDARPYTAMTWCSSVRTSTSRGAATRNRPLQLS